MNCQLLRLLSTHILVYQSLVMHLDTKVSKIMCQWILSLNPSCFCETSYLHFTTRVFGHSASTPFLGGKRWIFNRSLSSCLHLSMHLSIQQEDTLIFSTRSLSILDNTTIRLFLDNTMIRRFVYCLTQEHLRVAVYSWQQQDPCLVKHSAYD